MDQLKGVRDKYYNSDLNEYIGKKLPRVMTAIDIDLLMVKKYNKTLRVAEYKHPDEPIGKEQKWTLEFLADVFKFINNIGYKGWTFEVYVLRGSIPFDILECYNMISKETTVLHGQEVDDFLTMENE